MEISIPQQVWEYYGLNPANYQVSRAASGHINQTFIVLGKSLEQLSWVVQRINTQVFTNPGAIAQNIKLADNHLKKHQPDYLFIAPIPNRNGELFSIIDGHYWRLLPYITNTIALDVLQQPLQAYEAAKQFGKLSRNLDGINPEGFQATIPRFHDLEWRKEQFDQALSIADEELKMNASVAIELANQFNSIVKDFSSVKHNLPIRILHHDTKISNALLDKQTFEGKCVIDLDTLMPGYFISDLGDMMRTYLCAYDENEADLAKITIREEYFSAMLKGYLSEMGHILNSTEKTLILFSGKYMIYMQALRFLSDYLEGSIYYPIAYPKHNLDRSMNQFRLLGQLYEKEKILEEIVSECLN